MRIRTSIVPALAFLAVAASEQAGAQQPARRPPAIPQAQAPPPQADAREPRRLGRSYPMPPPPIPQREEPQFYVAAPQASSIHRTVGGNRSNRNRMGDPAAPGAP